MYFTLHSLKNIKIAWLMSYEQDDCVQTKYLKLLIQ